MFASAPQVDSRSQVLTDAERSLAQQVAFRLRAELLKLVGALPAPARTALGMSRAIGVSRTICHRLFSALQERDDILQFVTLVPGVGGLRQCVSKLKKQFPDLNAALITAADAAIDAFHNLIHKLSGSHSRLCARVRATREAQAATRPRTSPSRELSVRRQMYAAAAACSGRSIGARMSLSVLRPIAERPNEFEYVHVRAWIRQQASPGAVPWVVTSSLAQTAAPGNVTAKVDYLALDGSPLMDGSALPLITKFCGQPLPIVSVRDGVGRMTRVIDLREAQAGAGPIPDHVLAYRLPTAGLHHMRQTPPVHCEVVAVQDAIERMVFDVYLHRSLAAMVIPSMNLYFGRRDVDCDLTDRWFDRLEDSPLLTLLGPGIGNAHTDAWDRHAELTNYVFDAVGWPVADFAGYRCDEAYPLWGCDYVMAFEYRRSTGPLASEA